MAERGIKPEDRYLNFPISFLNGFMNGPNQCFAMILAYNIYEKVYSEYATLDSLEDFILNTEVETYELDLEELASLGEKLYKATVKKEESECRKIPKVGISIGLFNDFFQVQKSDFDLVCLLAYLAIRSIIQKSDYRNIKNSLLLARMAGYSNIGHPIPEEVYYWMVKSRYRRTKVLDCIRDRYKMKTAFKARGITCSFSLSQEDLEYRILLTKTKKKNKGNSERKKAKERALQKLKNNGFGSA